MAMRIFLFGLVFLLFVAPKTAQNQESSALMKTPEPYFETYTQKITLTFSSPAEAARAQVVILPLFEGREWAVTSRWDDTDQSHLKMRDVLARHGYRATFYLNGHEPNEDGLDKKLSGSGFTIGGHSWSHPDLPYCSRNRIFDEVARVRAGREATSDCPVSSFAFSYNRFDNPIEGSAVVRDIAEALYRAGYIHNAEGRSYFDATNFGEGFLERLNSEMPASNLLPPDGMAPIDHAFAAFLGDEEIKCTNPSISFDMHSWYETDEAWAQFESELEKYGHRPEWWYCNQSEYGAYRLQYLKTRVAAAAHGAELTVTLRRPKLIDLNDPVPISFEVRDINDLDGIRAACDTAELERLERDGRTILNIHHDRVQRLPEASAWILNEDNADVVMAPQNEAAFANIAGVLRHDSEGLTMRLSSADAPLEDVRVAYRLPLACAEGVVFQHEERIEASEDYVKTLALGPPANDYKYLIGKMFFVAQVDYMRDGAPYRLFLTCSDKGSAAPDFTYPSAGFARLGPLPEADWTFSEVKKLAESLPESVVLADGSTRTWESIPSEEREANDAEVVATTNRCYFFGNEENRRDGYYLLRSTIESESEQVVKLQASLAAVKAAYLNDKLLGEDMRGELESGPNNILLVYKTLDIQKLTEKFTLSLGAENVGAFLRLTAPNSGERLTNIHYILPSAAGDGQGGRGLKTN